MAANSAICNDISAAAILALNDYTDDDDDDDANIPVAIIVRQVPPSHKCICKNHSGDTRGCPIHRFNTIWDEHVSVGGEKQSGHQYKTAEDDNDVDDDVSYGGEENVEVMGKSDDSDDDESSGDDSDGDEVEIVGSSEDDND